MVSTYPFLVNRNMSSYNNWKTSIYLILNRLGKNPGPIFYTNATGNFTKADTLFF